jgi:hypothetical protein
MRMELKPLRNFGREACLKKKWLRLWDQIGERMLRLPKREQDILLEDFRVAIESRIMVMERVNDAEGRSDS